MSFPSGLNGSSCSMSNEARTKLVKIWSKYPNQLPLYKDLPRLMRGVTVFENDQKVLLHNTLILNSFLMKSLGL